MKNESGQSLFELVVAIAISALIVVVLVSLASNSIKTTLYSKNKTQAALLTQQASEWLRSQRDGDINLFLDNAVAGASPNGICLNALVWNTPILNPSINCSTKVTGTIFTRWVSFTISTQAGAGGSLKNVINADIVVNWHDQDGDHKVTNSAIFTDVRER